MYKENAKQKTGFITAIALMMIIAIGAVFTLPSQSFATSGNPPQNVKVKKVQYVGKYRVKYKVTWQKPKAKKGYELKNYQYRCWSTKDKKWSIPTYISPTKTSLEGKCGDCTSDVKKFKFSIRAVYKHKKAVCNSKWVTKSK